VILFLIISQCLDTIFKFCILLISFVSGDINLLNLMAYWHRWSDWSQNLLKKQLIQNAIIVMNKESAHIEDVSL